MSGQCPDLISCYSRETAENFGILKASVHLAPLSDSHLQCPLVTPRHLKLTCTVKVILKVAAGEADYLDIARIPLRRAECSATSCALQGQMSHIIPAVRLGFTPPGSNLARAALKNTPKRRHIGEALNRLLREVREKDSANVPHGLTDVETLERKTSKKPRSSVATNKSSLLLLLAKFKDKQEALMLKIMYDPSVIKIPHYLL